MARPCDDGLVVPAVHQWAAYERRSGALIDELTDLPNYRAFAQEMHAALTHDGLAEHLVLALVDLDDLITQNHVKGRAYGDGIIFEFAHRLVGAFPEAKVFRVGGDEFAVLADGLDSRELLERMNRFCFEVRAHLGGATASAGIVAIGGVFGQPADICAQAKCAMREAKNRGRANAVAFEDIRERSWLISSEQSRSLRDLLAEGHIDTAFQLIWDQRSGKALGFEALARFAPTSGFSGPQEAFGIAEKLGRAHELDALCHKAIVASLRTFDLQGLLFLNVSPQSLTRHLETFAEFARALDEVGVEPHRVVLEITERSNLPPATIALAAAQLRALGFKIALDDTGAGNSGLEILSQLQVDYLKIDRDVIVKACTARIARGVLIGIVAIAKENGSVVIAEGIENDIMLDLIRDIGGIDNLQGYLIGRPGKIPTALPDHPIFGDQNPILQTQ
jgi:diguanylate cyclase (GGDEF)-like protein